MLLRSGACCGLEPSLVGGLLQSEAELPLLLRRAISATPYASSKFAVVLTGRHHRCWSSIELASFVWCAAGPKPPFQPSSTTRLQADFVCVMWCACAYM